MEKYQCGIFGVRLAELRQKKKITQSELAEKLGVQRVTIAKYETGNRAPSIDNLISFSEFFQVSTDYLLGLSDNATTDTDLKAVCDYTGLSEDAVNNIIMLKNDKLNEVLSTMLDSQFLNIIANIQKMIDISMNLDTDKEIIEKVYNECLKSIDLNKIKPREDPFFLAKDKYFYKIYEACESLLDEKLNYLEYLCSTEMLKVIPYVVSEQRFIGLDKITTLIYEMCLEKKKEINNNGEHNPQEE